VRAWHGGAGAHEHLVELEEAGESEAAEEEEVVGKWWESEAEGYVEEEEGAFEPDEPDEAPLRRRCSAAVSGVRPTGGAKSCVCEWECCLV
jgi:hypothetical protein